MDSGPATLRQRFRCAGPAISAQLLSLLVGTGCRGAPPCQRRLPSRGLIALGLSQLPPPACPLVQVVFGGINAEKEALDDLAVLQVRCCHLSWVLALLRR